MSIFTEHPKAFLRDTARVLARGQPSSQGSVSSEVPFDIFGHHSSRESPEEKAQAEKNLLWKLDTRIYPVLYIVYALSFLDRINIGNALILGMREDLDLSGYRSNVAFFIYFIPYILLEIPSNILVRRSRPSLYLSGLMFCWGITNMCMGFAKSYKALVALRFLLGAFEAGVLPGVIYLTSMYYKRHEFQQRISVFFSSSLLAGAMSGLLGYAFAALDGIAGCAGWRWIFLVEGALTAAFAIAAVFLIVDWPEQCRLSLAEKTLLLHRLEADGGETFTMDTLNRFALKRIFSDVKIWLGALVYLGIGTSGYSAALFMPSLLEDIGWSAKYAEVQVIPVYAAAAVFMLAAGYLSDRLRHRYGFILGGCVVATIGYVMLLCQGHQHRGFKLGALLLINIGTYIGLPVAIGWLQNNLCGHWKRAFGASIQITLGNIAGLIASFVFLEEESPHYATGYGTTLGMLWVGGVAATIMFWWLQRENGKRDSLQREDRLTRPRAEVENMGDWHPHFRFTL